MQNAIAIYHVTQFMGRCSFEAGVSVHVCENDEVQLMVAMSSAVLADRFIFQLLSQPLPGSFGCAPAFSDGGCSCVPIPALTNARNRPTVTLYLSSRNVLTVAGALVSPDELSPATS